MNEDQIRAAIDSVKGPVYAESVDIKAGTATVVIDGLPELTFFLDLSKALGVPIESMETDSYDRGPGCDTCGYGGGPQVTLKFPAPEERSDDVCTD